MRDKNLPLLLAVTLLASPVHAQQLPDRDHPPELGAPPALDLPPIHRLSLSNGLRVVLVEKHDVPLVQVNLVVGAGSVTDPADGAGLASMTAEMLDEGAGDLGALDLSDEIDFLGASIRTGTGLHNSMVSLHVPLSKLDRALELMSDIALRPTFSSAELDRQRLDRITTLVQWHDEARIIAGQLFNRTLYGRLHPYGMPEFGTEDDLRSMASNDLRRFHESRYVPANSFLIVVGDVTSESVMPKLQAVFGWWTGGAPDRAEVPEVAQVGERRVYLVDKPGAAQSEIRIGRIGVPRLTDDYYPLLVMNTILGGSFASRLNMNLREDKGYSYGARSSFSFRPAAGPFVARAAVQTDVTDSALVEFMNELRRILEPVSDDELTRAKNFVALRFPGRFQTVSGVANQLSELILYDLPDDYFNQYVQRVLAVTREDVQRVAREYIDPERVAIIVVGDRSQVEEKIRALNLGPIEVMSIEQVLGPVPEMAMRN